MREFSTDDREKLLIKTRELCYAWLQQDNVRVSLVDHYLKQKSLCIMDFSSGIPGCVPISVMEVLKTEAGDRLVDVCFANCLVNIQCAMTNRMKSIEVLVRCLHCMPMGDDEDLNEREKYRCVMKTIAAYVEGDYAINGREPPDVWLRGVFQACGLLPAT
jgi:hypothetical protein